MLPKERDLMLAAPSSHSRWPTPQHTLSLLCAACVPEGTRGQHCLCPRGNLGSARATAALFPWPRSTAWRGQVLATVTSSMSVLELLRPALVELGWGSGAESDLPFPARIGWWEDACPGWGSRVREPLNPSPTRGKRAGSSVQGPHTVERGAPLPSLRSCVPLPGRPLPCSQGQRNGGWQV